MLRICINCLLALQCCCFVFGEMISSSPSHLRWQSLIKRSRSITKYSSIYIHPIPFESNPPRSNCGFIRHRERPANWIAAAAALAANEQQNNTHVASSIAEKNGMYVADDDADDGNDDCTLGCVCVRRRRYVYMTSIPFINQREKQNTFPRLPTPMCGFDDDDDDDDWGRMGARWLAECARILLGRPPPRQISMTIMRSQCAIRWFCYLMVVVAVIIIIIILSCCVFSFLMMMTDRDKVFGFVAVIHQTAAAATTTTRCAGCVYLARRRGEVD